MFAYTAGTAAFWLALALIIPIVRYVRARLRQRRIPRNWR